MARIGAHQFCQHLRVLRLQHFLQGFTLVLIEVVEVRHIRCFLAGEGNMQNGFRTVLMLDGLYIVADGIHIPEHRADKVDTLLVDGDNISSIGIGPSRFDCKHSDNICPVGDGKVAAAVRLPMDYHAVCGVFGLYLVDFRRKFTVDERNSLRDR